MLSLYVIGCWVGLLVVSIFFFLESLSPAFRSGYLQIESHSSGGNLLASIGTEWSRWPGGWTTLVEYSIRHVQDVLLVVLLAVLLPVLSKRTGKRTLSLECNKNGNEN